MFLAECTIVSLYTTVLFTFVRDFRIKITHVELLVLIEYTSVLVLYDLNNRKFTSPDEEEQSTFEDSTKVNLNALKLF